MAYNNYQGNYGGQAPAGGMPSQMQQLQQQSQGQHPTNDARYPQHVSNPQQHLANQNQQALQAQQAQFQQRYQDQAAFLYPGQQYPANFQTSYPIPQPDSLRAGYQQTVQQNQFQRQPSIPSHPQQPSPQLQQGVFQEPQQPQYGSPTQSYQRQGQQSRAVSSQGQPAQTQYRNLQQQQQSQHQQQSRPSPQLGHQGLQQNRPSPQQNYQSLQQTGPSPQQAYQQIPQQSRPSPQQNYQSLQQSRPSPLQTQQSLQQAQQAQQRRQSLNQHQSPVQQHQSPVQQFNQQLQQQGRSVQQQSPQLQQQQYRPVPPQSPQIQQHQSPQIQQQQLQQNRRQSGQQQSVQQQSPQIQQQYQQQQQQQRKSIPQQSVQQQPSQTQQQHQQNQQQRNSVPQQPVQQHRQSAQHQNPIQTQAQSQPQPQSQTIPSLSPATQQQQNSWTPQAPITENTTISPALLFNNPPPRTYSSPQTATQPTPSRPQQRPQGRVVIPVQSSPAASSPTSHMAPVPKRRRSNDGTAVPINGQFMAQKSNVPHRVQHSTINSSPLTELQSSQIPSTPIPSIDYQSVLLGLADEYVGAAYSMSDVIASSIATPEQIDEYQALMATAMGCLESVLKNYRLSDPRQEAHIRLRLASLMFEETDNTLETEELLSKGITLCERNRLTDIKYAMHHFMVRATHRSNPKAALKSIDKLVDELEALRLSHWVYTFRFLRVSLTLENKKRTDTAIVVKHLNAIARTADSQRNVTVKTVAAVYEAIVYLRSDSLESLEPAQRALATARGNQLGPEMQKLPQISALMDCLDVGLSSVHCEVEQLPRKVQQMQNSMETLPKDPAWTKDGSFMVPLGHRSDDDIEADTAGILKRTSNGETALAVHWLTRQQLFTLGYLVSSFASMYKSSVDGKAEEYLREGLKLSAVAPNPSPRSFASTWAQAEWSGEKSVAIRMQLAFAHCGRFEWLAATQLLDEIRKEDGIPKDEGIEYPMGTLFKYLEAMCKQGLGDLNSAYAIYNEPSLMFDPFVKGTSAFSDLCAIANLNKVLIIRALPNKEELDEEGTLGLVEPYCLGHYNKAITAAFYFTKSMSFEHGSIMKTKQHLQSAVNFSRAALSTPLLNVVMNSMTHLYFANIVGEQSIKSGTVGRSLAKNAKNRLWLAVANGMIAHTLDLSGQNVEAESIRRQGEEAFDGLPQELKQSLEGMMMQGR